MSTQDERIAKLEEAVAQIQRDLDRYKGFVGGVVFVGTCIFTFLSWVGPILAKKLGLG